MTWKCVPDARPEGLHDKGSREEEEARRSHPETPLLGAARAVTLHEAGRIGRADLRHVQTQQPGQDQLVLLVIHPLLHTCTKVTFKYI